MLKATLYGIMLVGLSCDLLGALLLALGSVVDLKALSARLEKLVARLRWAVSKLTVHTGDSQESKVASLVAGLVLLVWCLLFHVAVVVLVMYLFGWLGLVALAVALVGHCVWQRYQTLKSIKEFEGPDGEALAPMLGFLDAMSTPSVYVLFLLVAPGQLLIGMALIALHLANTIVLRDLKRAIALTGIALLLAGFGIQAWINFVLIRAQ